MKVDCSKCNKPTWKGCGKHIEQALKDVPEDERCKCPRDSCQPTATTVNKSEEIKIETKIDNESKMEQTKVETKPDNEAKIVETKLDNEAKAGEIKVGTKTDNQTKTIETTTNDEETKSKEA
jgi:hypothetical protein